MAGTNQWMFCYHSQDEVQLNQLRRQLRRSAAYKCDAVMAGTNQWMFCYHSQDEVQLNQLRRQLRRSMQPSLQFLPVESLAGSSIGINDPKSLNTTSRRASSYSHVSMAEEANESCGLTADLDGIERRSDTAGLDSRMRTESIAYSHPNDHKHREYSGYLVFTVMACTVGSSFQIGYNTGVVNTPETAVREWISASHEHMYNSTMSPQSNTLVWSMTVSIFSVGGCCGACASGWLADNCGRRGGLLINNVFAVTASLLMFSCKYGQVYWLLVIGRFIIGINSGLNSALAPMYLNEVSPRKLRGKLGSSHQLAVTVSILLSQTLGMEWALGNNQWHWLFTLPFCPESPVYNVLFRNNVDQAESDLCRLRGRDDVYSELYHMQVAADRSRAIRQVPLKTMLLDRVMCWPVIIAIVMMFSQQFSGINAVIYYSSNIFKSAGFSEVAAQAATLTMGCINVSMTIISLLLVDRLGRRPLHLFGLTGMFVFSILLVVTMAFRSHYMWVSIISALWVVLFVASFAVGPGSIPWFYASEIFTNYSRGRANSVAVMCNWLANFVVGLLFLPLKDLIDSYSMLVFTVMLALLIVFVYKYAPETKQKRFEDITMDMYSRAPFAHQLTDDDIY